MTSSLKRVLVGAIGIPLILLLTLLKVGHYLPFTIFITFISFLGTIEQLEILKQKWITDYKIVLLIFSILTPLAFYLYTFIPSFPFSSFILFAGIIAFFLPQIFKSNFLESLSYISHYFLSLAFIIFSLSFFILIINKEQGLYYIILLFFTVWFNDSFAYVTGVMIFRSKRHIIPLKVSPNKSYEGYIGGLIFGILAVFLVNFIFSRQYFIDSSIFNLNFAIPTFSFWQSLLIGFITVVSANLGDLFESIIKRSVNIKDSSNILPGHGGILDRFDSFFIATPMFYFLLTLLGK